MSKHDLRVKKTKKSIYDALTALLVNKPLANIKVTELCKVANINRGTFYFHYVEVSDVFEELFTEMMLDLRLSYEEPYKYMPHLELKSLDPKIVKIFHHVKKYEQFYSIILAKDTSMRYYYLLLDEIQAILRLDTHRKKLDNENPFIYAYTANAIIGLIIAWAKREFEDSPEDMNVQLVNIVTTFHKEAISLK